MKITKTFTTKSANLEKIEGVSKETLNFIRDQTNWDESSTDLAILSSRINGDEIDGAFFETDELHDFLRSDPQIAANIEAELCKLFDLLKSEQIERVYF